MPYTPTAYDAMNKLEMDAKLTPWAPIAYPITFDGNNKPLRFICMPGSIIYRRAGLDLTRDQAADLIHREQQQTSKTP